MLYATVPCWKQSIGVSKCHVQHLISSFHIHSPDEGVLYFFKGKATSAEHSLTNSTKLKDAWGKGAKKKVLSSEGPPNCCSVTGKKRNQAPGNAASNDLYKGRVRQRHVPSELLTGQKWNWKDAALQNKNDDLFTWEQTCKAPDYSSAAPD